MKHLQKIIKEAEAFFFDLDGTLIFTADLHEKAYRLACLELKISYENLIFPVSSELYEKKKKVYVKMLSTERIKLNEAVYEIYLDVLSKNKKVVIVTNTLQQNADKIVEKLRSKPDLVISGEYFNRIKTFSRHV